MKGYRVSGGKSLRILNLGTCSDSRYGRFTSRRRALR